MKCSFFPKNLIILAVVLMCFWSSAKASIVQAQNLNVDETIPAEAQINLPTTLILPDQDVQLTGTGEPGAQITVTALANGQILFSGKAIVSNSGTWAITIPKFTHGYPDKLFVKSEVSLTTTKLIETTTVIGTVATVSLVLFELLVERGLKGLELVGLFRRRKTKGYVFDVASKRPVPFALLTIVSQSAAELGLPPLIETVVSDVYGFFQTINLPVGRYTIDVRHTEYQFPTKLKKPFYATPFDFYQGEVLEFTGEDQLEICLIPLQPKEPSAKTSVHWLNFNVLQTVLVNLAHVLSVPMGLISLIMLWLYPSFVNFLIVVFYLALLLQYFYKRSQTRSLQGKVFMSGGKGVSQAVVRIFRLDSNELMGVTLTDNKGNFKMRLKEGKYRARVSKDELLAVQDTHLSFELIDLRQSQTNLRYEMLKR